LKRKRKSKRKDSKTCDVKGCNEDKRKSLPSGKVSKKTDLKIESSSGRNAYLCKEHYKEYKKATKEERTTKRLNWD